MTEAHDMDMTTTKYLILTIFIIIGMLFGARLIFNGVVRSLKQDKQKLTDNITHTKNGIPIIPRHLRKIQTKVEVNSTDENALANQQVSQSQGHKTIQQRSQTPVSSAQNNVSTIPKQDKNEQNMVEQANQQPQNTQTEAQEETDFIIVLDDDNEHTETTATRRVVTPNDAFANLATATEILMPSIETVKEPAFTEQSPVIDKYLAEKQQQDQNSPLNNPEFNINLTIQPINPAIPIRGDVLLSLIDKYGLKFGILNMFHRYKDKDGSGILWFSMMAMTEEGLSGFDINALPYSHYQSLLLFLPLPHPTALQGFDAMVSIAELMAKDLNAIVLDEYNNELTLENKKQLRDSVDDYQAQYLRQQNINGF